jgi:predicted metal-dependent phosphoesterase TrpH
LIDLAIEKGLQGLSITDHDTVQAYVEAETYAQERGLRLLPGVEFSASFRDCSIHILGYGLRWRDERVQAFCAAHSRRRQERFTAILERLAAEGIDIEVDASGLTSLGRPHIAQVLVEHGHAASVPDAFKRYLGAGKPCFVATETFDVAETIDVIHAAGGLAVLAHPMLIRKGAIERALLRQAFDGLEGRYACISASQERPWIQKAKERQWIVTGGSDFHGSVKPHIPLGASWVNEETFETLWSHYHDNAV